MSAEDFEVLRQHMLAEISAGTFHVRGLIGKAALAPASNADLPRRASAQAGANRGNIRVALAAILGVAALDVLCARSLGRENGQAWADLR